MKFDGGSNMGEPGYDLEIGSGMFIPGFEEGLIGMNSGETRDITVTFPAEYPAEQLAGKEAVFTVVLNSIKEKQIPELDDDFVSDVSEFETVDEYKADVKQTLEDKKFCPQCGTPVKGKFCGQCGKQI